AREPGATREATTVRSATNGVAAQGEEVHAPPKVQGRASVDTQARATRQASVDTQGPGGGNHQGGPAEGQAVQRDRGGAADNETEPEGANGEEAAKGVEAADGVDPANGVEGANGEEAPRLAGARAVDTKTTTGASEREAKSALAKGEAKLPPAEGGTTNAAAERETRADREASVGRTESAEDGTRT